MRLIISSPFDAPYQGRQLTTTDVTSRRKQLPQARQRRERAKRSRISFDRRALRVKAISDA
jgi:hypothetical protein